MRQSEQMKFLDKQGLNFNNLTSFRPVNRGETDKISEEFKIEDKERFCETLYFWSAGYKLKKEQTGDFLTAAQRIEAIEEVLRPVDKLLRNFQRMDPQIVNNLVKGENQKAYSEGLKDVMESGCEIGLIDPLDMDHQIIDSLVKSENQKAYSEGLKDDMESGCEIGRIGALDFEAPLLDEDSGHKFDLNALLLLLKLASLNARSSIERLEPLKNEGRSFPNEQRTEARRQLIEKSFEYFEKEFETKLTRGIETFLDGDDPDRETQTAKNKAMKFAVRTVQYIDPEIKESIIIEQAKKYIKDRNSNT